MPWGDLSKNINQGNASNTAQASSGHHQSVLKQVGKKITLTQTPATANKNKTTKTMPIFDLTFELWSLFVI